MNRKNTYKTPLKVLIFLSLCIQPSFASMDYLLSVYIPVTDPQSEIMDEDGIKLHKALFYTYFSEPESAVSAVTWKYLVNTPHKKLDYLKSQNMNLASREGLSVELKNYGTNECRVVIDSSKFVSTYSEESLNKLLHYVKKATKLNMKEHGINCPIEEIRERKKVELFPKALKLEESVFQALGKYASGIKGVPFLYERLYPLGYSSDGKIAYIKEYDTDPADMVLIRTFVQDLISDKILWKDEFRVENEIRGVDFETFWTKRSALISTKLEKYGIKAFEKLDFKNGTYGYGKEFFSLNSKSKRTLHKDWGREFLDSSLITLTSTNKGHKVIDKKEYKDEHILARKAIGFMPLNNDGKRVAVVVANVHRGWEGPPHNVSYDIVGASLSVGFKK